MGAGDDAPPNERNVEPPSERDIGLEEEDTLSADSRGMMDASARDQGTAERKGGCGWVRSRRVGGPWLGVGLLYGVLCRWRRRSRSPSAACPREHVASGLGQVGQPHELCPAKGDRPAAKGLVGGHAKLSELPPLRHGCRSSRGARTTTLD